MKDALPMKKYPDVPNPPQRLNSHDAFIKHRNQTEIANWKEYTREELNKLLYTGKVITLKEMSPEKQEEMKKLYEFKPK
jgi:hypothetical protein